MVVLFWKRTRKKMNKIKKTQSLCYFFSYQTLYVIVRCFKRCLAIQHFRNYSSVCVSLEMGDEKWGLLQLSRLFICKKIWHLLIMVYIIFLWRCWNCEMVKICHNTHSALKSTEVDIFGTFISKELVGFSCFSV